MGDKVKSAGVSVWTTVLCEIYVSLIVHLYLYLCANRMISVDICAILVPHVRRKEFSISSLSRKLDKYSCKHSLSE